MHPRGRLSSSSFFFPLAFSNYYHPIMLAQVNKYGVLPAREWSKAMARTGRHTEALKIMLEAVEIDKIDAGVRYTMGTSLLAKVCFDSGSPCD